MVILNPPRISSTPGKVFWKSIRQDENQIIEIQKYGQIGSLGKKIRNLKGESATTFRVMTTFKPYLELATSNENDEISDDFSQILSILPKKFTQKDEQLTEKIRTNVIQLTLDKIKTTFHAEFQHEEMESCTICDSKEVKIRLKCDHKFCPKCFDLEHENQCPCCKENVSNKMYEF
eukprot:gene7864-12334_t